MAMENDNSNDNMIVIKDDMDREYKFEHLDYFSLNDINYIVLKPVENESDEVFIMRVKGEEGREYFEEIDKEDERLEAFHTFKDRTDDIYDFQDE